MSTVIQLLDKFKYGGGENVALTYHEALRNDISELSIMAISSDRIAPFDNVRLYSGWFTYLHCLFIAVIKHKELFIISHTLRTLIVAIAFKILFPYKLNIAFVQHLDYSKIKFGFLKVASLFLKNYVQITPVNDVLIKKYIPAHKVRYINNFVFPVPPISDNDEIAHNIQNNAHGRKIIAFIGAMREGKGADDIVQLAKILPEDEYFFIIIGDGPCMSDLKKAMSNYLGNNILCTGYVDKPARLLKLCYLLFFTSKIQNEMMPMTVLEALNENIFVVGYNIYVNAFLLPRTNVFSIGDIDSIGKSILENNLEKSTTPYSESYGRKHLIGLIGS